MIMRNWLQRRSLDDSGSALVAAVAVGVIGMTFSIIVMAQAVAVTNDSQRDRVRTIAIHAAEAVLDDAILDLESTRTCTPQTVNLGTGATAVTVDLSIVFYDEDGDEIPCVSGSPASDPATALISSTATGDRDLPGIDPERTIEAKVQLEPIRVLTPGSAIFSAGNFNTGAGFNLSPADPAEPAALWVDSGDWRCNTRITVEGDIIVADGSASFQNSTCYVTGNLWARTGFTVTSSPANSHTVGGTTTVFDGMLTTNNGAVFGGFVAVGGDIGGTWHWDNTVDAQGGFCSDNRGSACTSDQLPEYTPRGLPEIDYYPSDWAGFTEYDMVDFGQRVISEWNLTKNNEVRALERDPCRIPGYLKSDPIDMPSHDSIWDLRQCEFSPNGGVVTLRINADTAIFAEGFQASNGLNLVSNSGEHEVWLIVPDGGTKNNGIAEDSARAVSWGTYDPGDIRFNSNALQVDSDLSVFVYTPARLHFPNTSATYGQLYGGEIQVGQGNGQFWYTGTGVPGVSLTPPSSSSSDEYVVSVVNKHETRND